MDTPQKFLWSCAKQCWQHGRRGRFNNSSFVSHSNHNLGEWHEAKRRARR